LDQGGGKSGIAEESLMSRRFSASERRALWEAFNRRCFYCGDPLRFRALEVDHVVPKALPPSIDRAKLFEALGLSPDWDVDDAANLVPACATCNRGKGKALPSTQQLIILLTKARDRAPLVERLQEQFEREADADRLRAQLEIGLAMGVVSASDMEALLHDAVSEKRRIQLVDEVKFLDGVALREIAPERIDVLYDVPIQLGAALPDGLVLCKSGDPRDCRAVCTVRQYVEAKSLGYDAQTGFAIKMEGFFRRALGVLKGVAAARSPEKSFIERPRIGLCDIRLIPSALLPYLGDAPDERKRRNLLHPTVATLVTANEVRIQAIDSYSVAIADCGLLTWWREVLRGDLDDDGVEDILVSQYVRALGGSFAHEVVPFALARRGPEELFEKTDIAIETE
jgi:5-methylcytosine-specific restriction endonuclease McrA